MHIARLQKLSITTYISTKDLNGNAGLWCQVRNDSNKIIGFGNIEEQGIVFSGTHEWRQYTLNLVVDTACKKLLLGGYIKGAGDIWYDDFAIESAGQSAGGAPASKEVRKFLDRFTGIIMDHSIYADKIDWPALLQDVASLSAGMTSVDETGLITSYVLSRLRAQGDNHSFIMNKARSEQSGRENIDGRAPAAKMLDSGLGYLYVPGFASTSDTAMRRFAENLQALIRGLDSGNTVNSWIVDMRENTGGNMYPMIAGLGALTGEGTLGYFIHGKQRTPWFYKAGASGEGRSRNVKLGKPYSLKNPAARIAVLIGPGTASSGEMTTVSFIGKPNVKLFGQPSGGYTTGNGMFKLSNGATLLLATSYIADRANKTYMGKIAPDVTVAEGEDALSAAQAWLLQP